MLQRAPWGKVFAIGPGGSLHKRHKVFCMICGNKVSMRARAEIKRDKQSPKQLRQVQRYREKCWPDTVRETHARILPGHRLRADHEKDHKRPFYHDVLEGKPTVFTAFEDHVRIEIQLSTTFLRKRGSIVGSRRSLDSSWGFLPACQL